MKKILENSTSIAFYRYIDFKKYIKQNTALSSMASPINQAFSLQHQQHKTVASNTSWSNCSNTLNHDAEHVDLIPFSRVIPRLQHVVHQIALLYHRPTELLCEYTNIQLEPIMLLRLTTALEQMLRHTIRYRVEEIAERTAKNKSTLARILLRLTHEQQSIMVSLTDDAQEIDVTHLLETAYHTGLIDRYQVVDNSKILPLIIAHSLQSLSQQTYISDHGMNLMELEVVQHHIQALGGEIQLKSDIDHGTTFTFHIPHSSTVDDMLILQQHQQQFALPLIQLSAVVRISSVALAAYFKGDNERFNIANIDYKLRYLSELINDQDTPNFATHTLWPVILLRPIAGENVALLVDNFISAPHQVATMSTQQQLSASIRAIGQRVVDGQRCFILDVDYIVAHIFASTRPKVARKI
ncbi:MULTISPECIES: ATP-binding protein [unclassified Acinetobacter]|uniref:ATP-binding protein n=1 Tax=unclassified Acinetobacter TaxID=196816 RepID=UPI002934F20B|nr:MULTISPECIES: ATP-binding protein [unclassified Acinetobacter]WOE32854.1 ATP-binding protein [Acinetobacter sp. SAAs470]WOE38331.1 ATP-binding protein [Acinetobacter sp. SAAs474]